MAAATAAWSEEQTFQVCAEGAEEVFAGRAPLLPQSTASSISEAVQLLNAGGADVCAEAADLGYCILFNPEDTTYVCLYRADKEQAAFARFLGEGEESEDDHSAVVEEDGAEGESEEESEEASRETRGGKRMDSQSSSQSSSHAKGAHSDADRQPFHSSESQHHAALAAQSETDRESLQGSASATDNDELNLQGYPTSQSEMPPQSSQSETDRELVQGSPSATDGEDSGSVQHRGTLKRQELQGFTTVESAEDSPTKLEQDRGVKKTNLKALWSMKGKGFEERQISPGSEDSPDILLGKPSKSLIMHRPWIESDQAEALFGLAILVNVILLGIDVQISLSNDRMGRSTSGLVLYILQSICLVIFIIELVLHCKADGCRKFWWRPMNLFDLMILVISIVDMWVMAPILYFQDMDASDAQAVTALRILQLLRLLRLLRIIRISRELTLLTTGLALSVRSVVWVFLLLFLCMYIGALLCAMQLGIGRPEGDPLRKSFGSVGSSIYAHYKMLTLEAWPEITDWACQVSGWWALYFVFYIMLTNMAIVNLLTGMIMEGVIENGIKAKEQSGNSAVEAMAFMDIIQLLLSALDLESEEEMTRAEFRKFISMSVTAEVLDIYDISLDFNADELFEVLDENGSNTLDIIQMVNGLLRLRGSRDAMHPVLVRCDVNEGNKHFKASLKSCEDSVKEHFETSVHRLLGSTAAKLNAVQAAAQQTLELAREDKLLSAEARRHEVTSHRRHLASLVQRAVQKLQILDESIRAVQEELHSSLEREAELEKALLHLECTQGTQTEADLFVRHEVSQATQTQESLRTSEAASNPAAGASTGRGYRSPSPSQARMPSTEKLRDRISPTSPTNVTIKVSAPSSIPHVAALPGRPFRPQPCPAPQVSDGDVLLEIGKASEDPDA